MFIFESYFCVICYLTKATEKMNQFDTSNPNHYTFTTEVLEFHILGGLNVNGLDRMRVTLKVNRIDNEFHALRHNIDLYNSNQVEKLVRRSIRVSNEQERTQASYYDTAFTKID